MARQRMQGRLEFGVPLIAAIIGDLIGTACIIAGFVLDLESGQRLVVWVAGGLFLLASSFLMIWQVMKHGRRVPNQRWR